MILHKHFLLSAYEAYHECELVLGTGLETIDVIIIP